MYFLSVCLCVQHGIIHNDLMTLALSQNLYKQLLQLHDSLNEQANSQGSNIVHIHARSCGSYDAATNPLGKHHCVLGNIKMWSYLISKEPNYLINSCLSSKDVLVFVQVSAVCGTFWWEVACQMNMAFITGERCSSCAADLYLEKRFWKWSVPLSESSDE